MFDICFYMQASKLVSQLTGENNVERQFVFDKFEEFRSREPKVYNIETTNACNMTCKMCPRTTMMTRSIESIDKNDFVRIVDQLEPHKENTWRDWTRFVVEEYGITENQMSENHFFLYTIPKVIQLHGYGDPLLDIHMPEYIKILSDRGLYSYFSCNPANVDIEKTIEMFDNGLDYIKYSIETVDNKHHKQIRGEASDFTSSYQNIIKLLDYKKNNKSKTTIIITMLDLNRSDQADDYQRLKEAFSGRDVYIYLKSEDQQWYRKDFHGTSSIHWSEFCKHPWMSVTVKSNAEIAMCMEDYNNEIILGNAKYETLSEIWNGNAYRKFREDHLDLSSNIKCVDKCDMKLIGNLLSTS